MDWRVGPVASEFACAHKGLVQVNTGVAVNEWIERISERVVTLHSDTVGIDRFE
jgi:hypothetical protein